MKTRYLIVIFFTLSIIACKAQTTFINDKEVYNAFKQDLHQWAKSEKNVPYATLQNQLIDKTIPLTLDTKEENQMLDKVSLCKEVKKAVFVIGKLFNHPKSGMEYVYQATCFAIGSDGTMVTNHHVFEDKNFDYKSVGVYDKDGVFYPVEKVLACSIHNDLAIFKINTEGKELDYLHLGKNPEIGSDVHIISHPKGKYYSYSTGYVTRAYTEPSENDSERMSISAEFAVGSSGAPIVDSCGNVVGVVSTTYPLSAGKQLQMVVKEITPVSNLLKITE